MPSWRVDLLQGMELGLMRFLVYIVGVAGLHGFGEKQSFEQKKHFV